MGLRRCRGALRQGGGGGGTVALVGAQTAWASWVSGGGAREWLMSAEEEVVGIGEEVGSLREAAVGVCYVMLVET